MQNRKNTLFNYLFLFSGAALVVTLDQWTKALARQNIPLGGSWTPLPWLAPLVNFVHQTNAGAAFGMFQGGSLLFTVLAVIISLGIIYFFPKLAQSSWGLRVALTMQLGGALGNLVDRILFNGHVTDFITLLSFTIINLADAFVTLGTAILILTILIEDHRKASQPALAAAPASGPDSPASPLS